MDGVEKAKSGHAGLPMGAAAMAYALWRRHLRHNPKNPDWFNRDRFILSAGHGSMLIYSLLHLTGYDSVPLDQLGQFRQWGSVTPGHPENTHTHGVEMATGPLGQGFATAVGFAIAERFLNATFNKPGFNVVDHYTYGICSDGDLMEGISSEAASLAGHLQLGKLIFLYDDNGITIDGHTDIAFTESVEQRFKAFGWHTQRVDGLDVEAVDRAISEAEKETERPSLILCKTIIGYGAPTKQGTSKAHSNPLGPDELKGAKEALGIPLEPTFYIADEALKDWRTAIDLGAKAEADWNALMARYEAEYPELAAELRRAIAGDLGANWIKNLPVIGDKIATRKASEMILQTLGPSIKTFIGGSADLAESNLTHMNGFDDFQPKTPWGKNINFGIREHGMAAAVNGMNRHGGVRAYGATFLIFSDYARPSIRLAALMKCPSIFVFTHDSIAVGEDGPTHEPIEQITSLRLIPNLNVFRPCDAYEAAAAWRSALELKETPTTLILSRQALPAVSPATIDGHPALMGGYVLREGARPDLDLVIVATGSEVALAVAAQEALQSEGRSVRVVSLPSFFLFESQDEAYRASVLPKGVKTLAVEAGATLGWYKYAQAVVGVDRFGASAPGDIVLREYGFTVENVIAHAKSLLGS